MLGRGATVFAMTLGCSSGAEVASSFDAGVNDSAVAVVDTGAASGIPRCGPGPWLIHTEVLTQGWGKNLPVADAPVRIDACPELEYRTDETGEFRIAFTVGQPYDIQFGLPGYPPIWKGRFSGIIGNATRTYFMKPPAKAPPFDPTKAVLSIAFYTTAGTGECNNWNGATVRVNGHDEARTHFWIGDVEVPDRTTPGISHITVDNLAPDIDVEVVGEKPGCDVVTYWWPNMLKRTRTHVGNTQVDVKVLPTPVDGGSGG